jgi:hypothetical protein
MTTLAASGVHGWTATDLGSDAWRSIVQTRVSGDGRVGALSGSGAGGVVASWRRGGAGRTVPRAPGVLRVLRQGAGQVRDAARARDRRSHGDGGGADARLLAGGVLSGGGGVRALGDGRVVGRAARPARSGEALAGGSGVLGGRRSSTDDRWAQRRRYGSPAAHQSGSSSPCASRYSSVRAACSQPEPLCPQNFQSSRAERL